jgi:hypothetical protein
MLPMITVSKNAACPRNGASCKKYQTFMYQGISVLADLGDLWLNERGCKL